MNVPAVDRSTLSEWRAVVPYGRRAGRLVFGDRRGLAVFLGALCYIGLLTRVGIFITDTYTTANAFVALTEGHLGIERAVYGLSLDTPGMHTVDGTIYGRNYGQLVFSLPLYWLLSGVSVVADLRIALVAGWSLLLVAFSVVLGRVLGYERELALGGAGAALFLFLVNVAVATPIPDRIVPVLAMQLTSILAGALVGVFTYRLVSWLRTPRTGVLAGVLVVLGTPISFWAPIPKRHVFTTLFVVLALFAFAQSRDVDVPHRGLIHGGAYAATGLLAWIHAPEALVLFTALFLADIVTSPIDRYRVLPLVGAVFVISLLPFFVTNYLIAGHPLVPPRLLRIVDSTPSLDVGGGDGGSVPKTPEPEPPAQTPGSETPADGQPVVPDDQSGQVPAGESGTDNGPGIVTTVTQWLTAFVAVVTIFVDLLERGFESIQRHSGQLYQTFVRSGFVANFDAASDEAINLSVLESAPILGAVVAVPLGWIHRATPERGAVDRLRQPAPATALAIGLFMLLFALMYAERLPLYAQVTVRYLIPLYAVGIVAVVLFTPIDRLCRNHARMFAWTVAGGVLLGGQLLAVLVLELDLAIGEAFQFHALLGIALAGVLGLGTLVATLTDRFDRLTVGLLGLTTASTAVFSLLVVTAYSQGLGKYPVDGGQLLPIVRVIAELLSIV